MLLALSEIEISLDFWIGFQYHPFLMSLFALSMVSVMFMSSRPFARSQIKFPQPDDGYRLDLICYCV